MEMLDNAQIAFLLMTPEDEAADGKVNARANVIHEVGLFQGRLGWMKAIVLLEDGCEEFSNIEGIGQIRYPKGNINAAFDEIREVLEREGVLWRPCSSVFRHDARGLSSARGAGQAPRRRRVRAGTPVDERSKMEPAPSGASSGQTMNEQRDRRCQQLAALFATMPAPVGAET